MKKIIFAFILLLCTGFILYCSYICIRNMNTIGSESDIKGKEIDSDEYIYKEDLLHLGYNLKDIEIIENKISNIDVKEYFLKEKYNNVSSYINGLYFIPKNIDRYVSYHNKNKNMSYDNVILNVNMNLDYEFYTNINTLHDYLDVTTLVNKYNKLPDNSGKYTIVAVKYSEINKTLELNKYTINYEK